MLKNLLIVGASGAGEVGVGSKASFSLQTTESRRRGFFLAIRAVSGSEALGNGGVLKAQVEAEAL